MNTKQTIWFTGFLIVAAVTVTVYFMQYANEKGEQGSQKVSARTTDVSGATIRTSLGDIEVVFLIEKSPKTVTNFISLAEKGFYDGTKFHRVIKDFMVQGGDPLSKNDTLVTQWGTGGPGYTFADEKTDEPLVRGIVAMANAGPNTNGSQFFIVTAEATPWLDGKDTPVVRVVSGIDVVDKIKSVETGKNDRPLESIVVENI